MGLDIVVEPAVNNVEGFSFRAGSYSGFNEFRVLLAKGVGIGLEKMAGFGQPQLVWGAEMPFLELLNHADNEGSLSQQECIALTNDFKKWKSIVCSVLAEEEFVRERRKELEYFKGKLREWERACALIAKYGGSIEFC